MVWADEITTIKQAATDADKYGGIIRGLQKSEVLYIDDFFKKPKGYTVTGAALKLHMSEATAKRRRARFIDLVGLFYGF
jgi:DNA replication protein DnaC